MTESHSELHAEIEKLEQKHSDNPEGRYFVPLANDYRKLGNLERAEELLREGIRMHPDYLSARIVLGRCLAERHATAEAIDEFTRVLSVDPQNLIALRTLGELAADEGRSEEALKWYRELLSVDPLNEDARRALESLSTTPGAPPPDEMQGETAWWTDNAARIEPDPDANDDEVGADDAELAPDDEFGGTELVTETIAELYARQGLFDRAANVYRELIRRRGDDPALRRRLEEVERQVANAVIPAEPDTFASSFEDGFDSGADSPPFESERETAAPAASASAREYLSGLAAWRPAEPAEADIAADDMFPWETSEPDGGEEGAIPIADLQPASSDDAGSAADWNQQADDDPAIELEDYFSDDDDSVSESSPSVSESVAEAPPEPDQQAEPTENEPAESASTAVEDNDDDLESFQSWLRSLKR
jgi:tetratricopeptide (TPR) repeat protein